MDRASVEPPPARTSKAVWVLRCALVAVPLGLAWSAFTWEAVGNEARPGAAGTVVPASELSLAGGASASSSASSSASQAAPVAPPASASAADVRETTAPALASAAPVIADTPPSPPEPCPPEMVRVGKKACIDRWEAHLVVVEGDTTSPWPHYQRPERGRTYQARSEAGAFPQGYISRVESAAACKSAGKRLCRMSEWRQACEGSPRHRYPYGARRIEGRCNSGKPHLLQARFGMNPGLWKYDEHFNDPALNQLEGWLAKGGSYEGCVSDSGVYDLVGNLHEWVADTVDERFMEAFEAEGIERHKQPWHTGNGVFLGGFFSTTGQLGGGCRFTTVAHEPAYHDYSTGFRCCAAQR